jgi:hypothetical protein
MSPIWEYEQQIYTTKSQLILSSNAIGNCNITGRDTTCFTRDLVGYPDGLGSTRFFKTLADADL